MTVKHVALMPK